MKKKILLLYLIFITSSWFVSGHQLGVTFVILCEDQDRHIAAAQFLAEEIEKAAKEVNFEVSVYVDGISWPARFSWVYFPLLQILSNHYLEAKNWVVLLNEWNRVDLEVLQETLSVYDSHEMIYLGHAISDSEPSIIHHFDEVDRKNPQFYPDMRTAIILSAVLVRNLADKWTNYKDLDINFSIDAPYEFTKFVNKDNGPKLLNNLSFCINHGKGCSVSYHPRLNCGGGIEPETVHFAVKTYSAFHKERLPVIKDTWLKDVRNFALYSDVKDEKFGTVTVGVPNTQRGHCGKTMAIIRKASKMKSLEWLAVVDDDTLLNVGRLLSLLSCYDSDSAVAVGERYGYSLTKKHGYSYLTGGSGMIFSKTTVSRLSAPGACECPSNSTPDDMFLGMCLQELDVPLVHSTLFHQTRPMDYPSELLRYSKPISFHKYWMMDPRKEYQQWLEEPKQSKGDHGTRHEL